MLCLFILVFCLHLAWTGMAFSKNYGNGASKNVKKIKCLHVRGLIVWHSVFWLIVSPGWLEIHYRRGAYFFLQNDSFHNIMWKVHIFFWKCETVHWNQFDDISCPFHPCHIQTTRCRPLLNLQEIIQSLHRRERRKHFHGKVELRIDMFIMQSFIRRCSVLLPDWIVLLITFTEISYLHAQLGDSIKITVRILPAYMNISFWIKM